MFFNELTAERAFEETKLKLENLIKREITEAINRLLFLRNKYSMGWM